MKLKSGKFRGMNKEATAIEQSVKALIRKYGLALFKHVSNKIVTHETNKVNLERDISRKEKELAELRGKKV